MSVDRLSTKQFGGLFGASEGFSTDMRTGASPTSGYMVALSGSERTISSPLIHPSDLSTYASDHAERLSQPGHYMGGWNDVERGQVDLDTSVNMPSGGPIRHAEAKGAMITHGQKSMYNVDTGGLEWNDYYGLSRQQAHAQIKSQYESAAGEHR
jgi:hypothetical protein